MDFDETARSDPRGSTSKLETLVNVAVLVAALLVVVYFVDLLVSRYAAPSPTAGVTPGMRLALPSSSEFAAHERMLILALQDGCSHCEDSMPFYRQLAATVNSECADVGLVAAVPHPRATADAMLARFELDVPRMSDVSLASLGVPGTPTLILVDQAGNVLDVWVGRLSREREKEVIAALQPIQACT